MIEIKLSHKEYESLHPYLIELKRLFTQDFTLTKSTGSVELRFLKQDANDQTP